MWCGRGVVPKPMRIQREGAQLQIRGTWSAGPGDDQARFLADLRALRDSAAIGYDELAARAHYPSDVLKEAENGPGLPGLPTLTAYVRACEGDVLDWEERWRRLNPDVPDDPDLPVRPAGASAAAQAGARAGVGVAPPDVYDPERIRAALRGVHSRTGQTSRRSGDSSVSAPAASGTRLDNPDQGLTADAGASADGWETNSGWDAAPDPGVTAANGNHSAGLGNRGPFDAAFTTLAEPTETASDEEFSWLQKSEPDDGRYSWSGQAEATRPAEHDDSDVTWPNAGLASRIAAGSGQADPGVTEQIPRHQAEGLAAREQTDFWGHPVPSARSRSAHACRDATGGGAYGHPGFVVRRRHRSPGHQTGTPDRHHPGPAGEHGWGQGTSGRARAGAARGPLLPGAAARGHRDRRAHRQRAGLAAEIVPSPLRCRLPRRADRRPAASRRPQSRWPAVRCRPADRRKPSRG